MSSCCRRRSRQELDLQVEATTLGLKEVPNCALFRQQAANKLHEAYLQVRRKQEYMASKRKAEILAKEGPLQRKRVEYNVGLKTSRQE